MTAIRNTMPKPFDEINLFSIRSLLLHEGALADGSLLRLTQSQVDALPEYSGTLPTGLYVGKRWKRNVHPACIKQQGPSGMKQTDWRIATVIEGPEKCPSHFAAHNPREGVSVLIQWSKVEIVEETQGAVHGS